MLGGLRNTGGDARTPWVADESPGRAKSTLSACSKPLTGWRIHGSVAVLGFSRLKASQAACLRRSVGGAQDRMLTAAVS